MIGPPDPEPFPPAPKKDRNPMPALQFPHQIGPEPRRRTLAWLTCAQTNRFYGGSRAWSGERASACPPSWPGERHPKRSDPPNESGYDGCCASGRPGIPANRRRRGSRRLGYGLRQGPRCPGGRPNPDFRSGDSDWTTRKNFFTLHLSAPRIIQITNHGAQTGQGRGELRLGHDPDRMSGKGPLQP